MSQNPYATPGRIGGDDFSGIPVPARMSVMAVIALVCGILGCLPLVGVIAILLGVTAIFLIAASKGRVRGTGLAVGGIVLGLIFTAVYVFIAIGAVTGAQQFNAKVIMPAQAAVKGIQTGDRASIRKLLTPASAAAVTDAQIDQFAGDVKSEFGAFKSSPNSIIDLIKAVRQMSANAQGSHAPGPPGRSGNGTTFNNAIPWPMEFEKGSALLLLEMDPSGTNQPNSSTLVPIINIGLVRLDQSKEIWLLPRGGTTSTPTPTPTPAPAPTAAPATPSAPAAPATPPEKPTGGG
jgi:hypothetical protein